MSIESCLFKNAGKTPLRTQFCKIRKKFTINKAIENTSSFDTDYNKIFFALSDKTFSLSHNNISNLSLSCFVGEENFLTVNLHLLWIITVTGFDSETRVRTVHAAIKTIVLVHFQSSAFCNHIGHQQMNFEF